MSVFDAALGRDDEGSRSLRRIALRNTGQGAVTRRSQPAADELGTDDLLCRTPLEPDRVVTLPFRVTEAVEWNAPLSAEVIRGFGPILKDGDDVGPGLPELLVGLAQLSEVFTAERSAEVAHEGHDKWPLAPALGEPNVALARLEHDVREGVADREQRLTVPQQRDLLAREEGVESAHRPPPLTPVLCANRPQ